MYSSAGIVSLSIGVGPCIVEFFGAGLWVEKRVQSEIDVTGEETSSFAKASADMSADKEMD